MFDPSWQKRRKNKWDHQLKPKEKHALSQP